MKLARDPSHVFGGLDLPCDGTPHPLFRVVPRDLAAEFWKMPVNGRPGMAETRYHLFHRRGRGFA